MIIDNITLRVLSKTREDVNQKTGQHYQMWEVAANGDVLNLVFKPQMNPNVNLTPNTIINCSLDLIFKKTIKNLATGPFNVYSIYGSFYNVIVKHQGIAAKQLYEQVEKQKMNDINTAYNNSFSQKAKEQVNIDEDFNMESENDNDNEFSEWMNDLVNQGAIKK